MAEISDERKVQMKSRWPLVTRTISTTIKGFDSFGRPFKRRVMAQRTFLDMPKGRGALKEKKRILRQEANERQRQWQSKSLQEQLNYLEKHIPNGANKQKAKIKLKIEQEKNKPKPQQKQEQHPPKKQKHAQYHQNDKRAQNAA